MTKIDVAELSNTDLLQLIESATVELKDRECHRVSSGRKINVEEWKSANQQRAELIQRAREFVEEHTVLPFVFHNGTKCLAAHGWYLVPSFTVNYEKRTVVCLLKSAGSKLVKFKGIAKCMPGDVFHTDIGKSIALARALQIEVPQEFLEAVQPDEVVKGMKIRRNYFNSKETYEQIVKAIEGNEMTYEDGGFDSWISKDDNLVILDDTNAEYEEVAQ